MKFLVGNHEKQPNIENAKRQGTNVNLADNLKEGTSFPVMSAGNERNFWIMRQGRAYKNVLSFF